MKIRRLTLKVKLKTPHSAGVNGFDAEITERTIIAPVGKLGEISSFEDDLTYVEIDMYKVSKTFQQIFSYEFNTCFWYKKLGQEYTCMAQLKWWEIIKLKYIMGDHIIQKDGNFKWLVGTVLTVLFFVYQAKQNDKLVQANKDITNLKDSLNKYQNNISKLK